MAEETCESHKKERKLMSRSTSSRWSKLHDDILISILNLLSSLDVLRVSAVCTCWFNVVQSHKSSSSFTPKLPAPWLILPPPADQEEATDGCCFSSVEDNKSYKQKKIFNGFGKSRCIGSSHGWLVLLDERADPYLLNPLTRELIQLPSLNTLEDVVGITRFDQGIIVRHSSNPSNKLIFMSLKQLLEKFIHKAILSADPFYSDDFAVIVIYNKSKIAFWKRGNITWKDFHSSSEPISDIICTRNLVLAVSSSLSVHIWDFSKYPPLKKMKIKTFQPVLLDRLRLHLSMLPRYSTRDYLVESLGQVLHVERIVEEFPNEYGWRVPNIQCGPRSYKTLQFNVRKWDFNHKQWELMNSLDGRVLFLGVNHSMSLSTQDFPRLKKNSIYFTDDYWTRINESQLYGGHDTGIFSLEEKRITHRFKHRIHPPPSWFVPNPWQRKNMK